MLEISYSLASLGQIVRIKFDNLLEAIRALPKDIAPDVEFDEETDWKETIYQEKERFELWSNNLGLYHKGHSSLDYRFRDEPDVFDHASDVLLEIGEAQENVLHCLKTKNEECAVTPETPRKGQDIQPSLLAKAGPLYSDGESEEEDLDGYDEPGLELSLTLEQIVLCNTKLYRLSSKIQSLRSRHGMGHAHKLMDVDRETGRDLMDAYAEYDEQHIREFISLLYKNSNQSSDVSSIDWLIKRLAQANTLRRKQFKQWRRHHDKVSRASNIAVARFEQLRRGIEASVQDSNILNRDETLHRLDSVHGSEKSLSLSLPSAATRLLPGAIDIKDDRSIRTSSTYFHFAEGPNLELIQVPKLPSTLQEKDSFECPFCFILCSKRMTRLSAWTTHVWHDLRPYICTFPNCKTADHIFSTVRQWISHEDTHSSTQDDVAQRKASCPFCAQDGVSVYHIASHMQKLALFALPRTTDYGDGENNEQGSYVSDGVSDRARQDSTDNSLRPSLLSSSDVESSKILRFSDSSDSNSENGPASVSSSSDSEQDVNGDLESVDAEDSREPEYISPENRISITGTTEPEEDTVLDETELNDFTATDHGSRSFEDSTYREPERAPMLDRGLESAVERNGRHNSDFPSGLNLCLICFARFLRYSALQDHFEQFHMTGTIDPCSVCSASALSASHRAGHELSHIYEEKGYVCQGITPADRIAWGCEQRFCFLESRTEHFRSVHGQTCMEALNEEVVSGKIIVEPSGLDPRKRVYPKAVMPFLPLPFTFLNRDLGIAKDKPYRHTTTPEDQPTSPPIKEEIYPYPQDESTTENFWGKYSANRPLQASEILSSVTEILNPAPKVFLGPEFEPSLTFNNYRPVFDDSEITRHFPPLAPDSADYRPRPYQGSSREMDPHVFNDSTYKLADIVRNTYCQPNDPTNGTVKEVEISRLVTGSRPESMVEPNDFGYLACNETKETTSAAKRRQKTKRRGFSMFPESTQNTRTRQTPAEPAEDG